MRDISMWTGQTNNMREEMARNGLGSAQSSRERQAPGHGSPNLAECNETCGCCPSLGGCHHGRMPGALQHQTVKPPLQSPPPPLPISPLEKICPLDAPPHHPPRAGGKKTNYSSQAAGIQACPRIVQAHPPGRCTPSSCFRSCRSPRRRCWPTRRCA
jgi:hypothetical protein